MINKYINKQLTIINPSAPSFDDSSSLSSGVSDSFGEGGEDPHDQSMVGGGYLWFFYFFFHTFFKNSINLF